MSARGRDVARRIIGGSVVVATSAVLAPYAAAPGMNAADLLLIMAPIIFLVAVRPRVSKTPAGSAASPNAVSATPHAIGPAGSSSDCDVFAEIAEHEARFMERAERLGYER